MSAFLTAVASLSNDPNLGVAAQYRAGGMGPPLALRVIRSIPDRIGEAFGTAVLQATDMVDIGTADVAEVTAGDTIIIGADVLTALVAERDSTGATWRVSCRR